MDEFRYWHTCVECGATFKPDKFLYTCKKCDGLLLVERDEDFVKKMIGEGEAARNYFDTLRFGKRRKEYPNDSGVWQWRDLLLPGFPLNEIISLKEGQTDLFEIPKWLKKETGLENLFIKLEGQAPSESFKDRGMPVAISDALRLKRHYPASGITGISCASTGDTSASAAIYAGYARDELSSLVLVPYDKISGAQLFQAMAHGAKVRAIKHKNGFDGCMQIIQEFTKSHPELVLVNSKNDMRIVGQESLGFEIIQDLNWKVPDWISIPAGNGGNLTALLNGLLRAKKFGLIDRLPGILVAQTAVADTLVRWSESEFKEYKPGKFQESVASAMNINNPVSFPRIAKLHDAFDMRFYRVSEPTIMSTWAQFMRAGANICPQGAVALNAVLQAREAKIIKPRDQVVAISTASALKFSEAGNNYHINAGNAPFANPFVVSGGTLEELEATL